MGCGPRSFAAGDGVRPPLVTLWMTEAPEAV